MRYLLMIATDETADTASEPGDAAGEMALLRAVHEGDGRSRRAPRRRAAAAEQRRHHGARAQGRGADHRRALRRDQGATRAATSSSSAPISTRPSRWRPGFPAPPTGRSR